MAKEKDDLADALAALAAGHHGEAEHDEGLEDGLAEAAHVDQVEPAAHPPAPPPAAAPPRPAPPRGLTPVGKPVVPIVRPASAAARPVAPARPTAPPPAAAKPRPAAPVAPRSTSPTRPAAPAAPASARPVAPAVPPRAVRPSAPAAPPPPPADEGFYVEQAATEAPSSETGDWQPEPAEDPDDMMMAPAPDAAMLAHLRARRPAAPSSNLKQTMVPILLTVGTLLILFGVLKFVLGPDSPYYQLPLWLIITACSMGTVLLALGFFTAFQVRDELARSAKTKPA